MDHEIKALMCCKCLELILPDDIFRVIYSGGDSILTVHIDCDEDRSDFGFVNKFENDKSLHGRFPVKVTLKDSNGN